MNTFGSKTLVKKTRKEHKCLGCLKDIPKGSAAINETGYYEDFYNYYVCVECEDFMKKDISDHGLLDEGVFPGFVIDIKKYNGLS